MHAVRDPADSPATTSVVLEVTALWHSPPSSSIIFCASLLLYFVSVPVKTTYSPDDLYSLTADNLAKLEGFKEKKIKNKEELANLLNHGLRRTLSRSLITTITTLNLKRNATYKIIPIVARTTDNKAFFTSSFFTYGGSIKVVSYNICKNRLF